MAEKLWTARYMRETDSRRRREILDEAVAEEGMQPDNELRLKLWESRYEQKDGREIDHFIRGWVNLLFIDNVNQGLFSKKRVEKEKKSVMADWQFSLAAGYPEIGEQVLYEELFNTARLYMELCEDDKTYGSVLLGLGHMKKEKLVAKIARDIYRVAYQIPRKYDMEEELAVFTKAATDAYCEVYDRQKELLLVLIRSGEEE